MTRALPFSAILACASLVGAQYGGSSQVAGPVLNGQEITCDLAPGQQFKNIGSRKDGAGMCVFTSIEMAARAQGLEEVRGWRDWCAANFPGGGYPEKVDALLKKWGAAKGIRVPDYLQYSGKDPAKILELIDKTGRMACLTYGYSPRYGGGTIYHMVCCPRFRGSYGVVLDNNFVAKRSGDGWDESIYEWMSRDELCRRAMHAGGTAWIFVWLPPPPPPPPKLAPKPKEG